MSDEWSNNLTWAKPKLINYEEKTLDELKEYRKRCNVESVQVNSEYEFYAYLIRMIDILLEKVERLENK